MDSFFWIIIVNLALYAKTLSYKFVSDDFAVFKTPPKSKNFLHKIWQNFTGSYKVMLPSLICFRGKWSVRNTEEYEHLMAILLHTVICCLIYVAFGMNQISFLAALLYSTNPVNNQATIWPAGRGYALPILMILLTFAFPIGSPLFLWLCSWFTIGFLAPLCLLGSTKWYLIGVAIVIWAIHARKFITAVKNKAGAESFVEDRLSFHPKKFVLAIKTFGFYTMLCIIPFRITFYHNFLQSAAGCLKHKAYTIWDRYFWIGLGSIGFIIGVLTHGEWSTLHWALLAWCITIAPFCNFVRANQEIAERFCALPNIFLMYALAQAIHIHPVIISAFIVFYATRAYYTSILYKDEYFITEAAIIEDPHAWWAWHCRAMKRWDTQSYREALILWVMARMISPKEFKLNVNIATCLKLLKNEAEADKFIKIAEENIVPGQESQAKDILENYRSGKMPILL